MSTAAKTSQWYVQTMGSGHLEQDLFNLLKELSFYESFAYFSS